MFFDATMLIMSLVLAVMTYRGINSAVLFLVSVLLPLLVRDKISHLLNVNYRGESLGQETSGGRYVFK